MHLIKY
ncbi:uncharacterized protein FFM5_03121 [Fusarium fujikuroi]|nr:uncharacterized protein FFM5_03121 [Fusarium fujikuroi]